VITKINETFSLVTDVDEERLITFLRVLRPDAYFNRMVKMGFQSPYRYFTAKTDKGIVIYNGHRFLLKSFGIDPLDETSNVSKEEVLEFIKTIKLPFEPYDYQIDTVVKCLTTNKILIRSCTGSGKSLSISLILEFFRRKGLRGVLVVPNINLLIQFSNDIKSYGLEELSKEVQLLGDGNVSDFSSTVTITTWQSMLDYTNKVNLDFIICDEAHKETGDTVSSILKESINTKIKLGFTGTLPEDPVAKMMILGLFGEPYTVITAKELIERGLATPVNIKSVFLNYSKSDCALFRELKDFQKQLKFIKEHNERHETILKIITQLREKGKNTLVLYQHTEHGKQIFTDLVERLYPDVKVENSMITGKKAFEFQVDKHIFFMNGEVKGDIREKQRNILETLEGSVLIANYSIMSTGANLKNLHCLVFASPLKAFTTISQSLGRLMRKHNSKKEAVIFDIVDNLGKRCIFIKQYKHRVQSSYIPEEFNIQEVQVNLKGE